MTGAHVELSLGKPSGGSRADQGPRPGLLVLVHRPVSNAAPSIGPLDFDSVDATLSTALGPATMSTRILGREYMVELTPTDLESFDPGQLARHFPVLETLSGLCRDLRVAGRAGGARQRLAEMLPATSVPEPEPHLAEPLPATAQPAASPRSEFARLLGSTTAGATRESETAGRLIRTLVEDSADLTPQRDAALIEAVEAVRLTALRSALASPGLRLQERTWRAVHWLVTGTDPEDGMRAWLVAMDLREGNVAGLHDLVRRHEVLGESGVAAMVADAEFDTPEQLSVLEALGELAARLGTTVLAAAPRPVAEAVEPEQDGPLMKAWHDLRRTRGAAHVAAAYPRLLMRLPYGRRGEACDLDSFEELEAAPDHESFLWGNPAYGLARLLGQAWERDQVWPPVLSGSLLLEDMPLAVYHDGTGDAIKPPAERFLDEQDIARLAQLGIVSLRSFRNRDAVQLSAFHALTG